MGGEMINPAGISGEASSGKKKFCVQTEFAPRPKPRITTSVSLNGEVVQKVENLWEKLPQSEEDRDEIERFLRKQHQEVIKNIKEKEEKFVSSKNEAKGIAVPLEKQPRRTNLVVNKKSLGLLIEAVNLVAKELVKTLGSYPVTQNLRKSKEMVVKEFPFVASFYVDNKATVSLIKGREELLDERLMISLIKWIYLFINSSDQTQSLDIRDLTAEISPSLEEIGFYSVYRRVADLMAQDS
jgi:hypothetical protein